MKGDKPDPPEPISDHLWRRVPLADGAGKLTVEVTPREGGQIAIRIRAEDDSDDGKGGRLLEFRRPTDDPDE